MRIKSVPKSAAREHQITDERIYRARRSILKGMGFIGASGLLTPSIATSAGWFSDQQADRESLTFVKNPRYATDEKLTPEEKVTTHNNFYEFGTAKSDPFANAQQLETKPWTLMIDGLVERPVTLNYDQLFSLFTLEERIYRLRCVEAWSMVIPWLGFPLKKLLSRVQPLSSAKYVALQTLYDPEQMPGQANRFVGGGIDYPYVEGLRLDEAGHPLTILSVGLYGKTLAPQNGAPIRLVVPWKYGFKSIKSLVRITLTDTQPPTSWNQLAPGEYGFFANVNPGVDHPRWSQASERRLTGGGLFARNRIPTQMFNGYNEVADLYKGMDLKTYY